MHIVDKQHGAEKDRGYEEQTGKLPHGNTNS